jgi:hypothetical protein
MKTKPKARRTKAASGTSGYWNEELDVGSIINQFFAALANNPNVKIVEVSIPPEMFRKLVMLCHPDKHGNSELSQEVTRWLIQQRDKR